MKILCFGDSNTFGYDPRGYFGGRYDEKNRWTDILAGLSGDTIINDGQNGRSIPRRDMELRLFENSLKTCAPDLLAVMLGTNDILAGASAEETAARMETFLCHVGEGCRILLVSPPAASIGEWVQNESIVLQTKKLASLYKTAAADKGAFFLDAGRLPLAYDGVHLSEEGHRILADRLHEYINCNIK